jgi:hypothetical protein
MNNSLRNNSKNQKRGSPSCKSMEGAKYKKNPVSEAHRVKLAALSTEAKFIKKMLIAGADSEIAWLQAGGLTINEILIAYYIHTTGAKAFKTFYEWKECGFKVKAEETAFRIWGAPRLIKNRSERPDEIPADAISSDELNAKEFFPPCCVFSDLQVEPAIEQPQPISADRQHPLTQKIIALFERCNFEEIETLAAAEMAAAKTKSSN